MKKSLFDFLIESWHLSYARASFFLFGLVAASPMIILEISLSRSDISFSPEKFSTVFETHPLTVITLIILSITVALLGKSLLITNLNAQADHSSSKFVIPPIKKSILIESAIILFTAIIILPAIFPSFIASTLLGVVPKEITWLSIAFIFFILFMMTIVREYSLAYALLTPLRFWSTFESAARLYIRFQIPSLLYGVFLLLITVVFTFFSNLVMLGITALLQTLSFTGNTVITTLVVSFLFSSYAVYEQALWITFFRSLVLPPKTPSESNVSPLAGEINNNVPGITT